MPPRRHWSDLTTEDFKRPNVSDWIAVLPVAATEQHGPHLPLSTDTIIAEGHIERTIERLPPNLPAVFLPTQAIAWSLEHVSSPGTLTLDWDTVTRTWLEIGACVARSGVRKLVIVNAHGGNVPIMDLVTRELRVRHDMLAVATSWSRFGRPHGLFSEGERKFGIHGGDIETSMVMAIRPDLVRLEHLADFASAQMQYEKEFAHLRAYGPSQFGWKAQDLNPTGAIGAAILASAQKGEAAMDHAVTGFIELLADVDAFSPDRLWRERRGPPGGA